MRFFDTNPLGMTTQTFEFEFINTILLNALQIEEGPTSSLVVGQTDFIKG